MTVPKEDYLSQIWSVSTTLTEEAMAAALKKCMEMNFDPDRGIVPLRETFINLSSARAVLEDAIEKQKLIQLPITVQKEILANIQAVSKSVQGLTSGADEVVNLTNAVEVLNTSIWKYGLHNLSDQVLGYQKKLNQLKNQEVQISKAISELEIAQGAAQKARLAASEIEQKNADGAGTLALLKQNAATSTTSLEQIKDVEAKASSLQATIQQQEKQGGELISNLKTANNELLSLDGSIRKFYSEVEDYRGRINKTTEDAASMIRTSDAGFKKLIEETTTKMDAAVAALHSTENVVAEELRKKVDAHSSETKEALLKSVESAESSITTFQKDVDAKLQTVLEATNTSSSQFVSDARAKIQELENQLNERSSETIEANKKKTESLVEELAKLKDQVREQIQQATGFTLFGAFQSRQNKIATSKNFWVWAIAVLIVISAGVTVWIAHEAQYYRANDFAFWVKLSLTVPLGFAITFCTVQYSRERRLEEEYAFKSSISVSLNPYRDLIHSMLEKDGTIDQAKYTEFVIDSVRNVFTPPTDRVFEGEKKPRFTAKMFEQTAKIIGTAVKAAK
jgi:hypothetical protein